MLRKRIDGFNHTGSFLVGMSTLFLLISFGFVLGVNPQEAVSHSQDSCSIPSDAARSQDGELLFFTSEQLMGLVLEKAPVEKPLSLKENNLFGTVVVDVVVKKDGRLSCIRPIQGHPLARAAVIRSLRKWVFKSYRSCSGKKSMVGVLEVPFDFR
ncbi:MAG: energy transducer TonB [Pyrinomonadaceae bacterium]|nr:energy transducer TonB [Pyrinomonadaceae bacterium]